MLERIRREHLQVGDDGLRGYLEAHGTQQTPTFPLKGSFKGDIALYKAILGYFGALGGSWNLASTYNWACNPTSSLPSWPDVLISMVISPNRATTGHVIS